MGASRKEQDQAGKGLVAVRRGALGDTILFLPVLQAFRKAWPGEETLFVGHGDYLDLVSAAGLAERTASASTWPPLLELHRKKELPREPPGELSRARRVLLEWGEDREWGRVRLFRPAPEEGRREPYTRQLLERLGLVSFVPWPPSPLGRLRRELAFQGEDGPSREGPALLHPGAGSPAKAWPPGRFARLGRLLQEKGWEVQVLLGPVEEERGPAEGFFRERGLPAVHLRDSLELARRLVRARVYVGNDSGPSHLAAALGVPSLVLFGPTDPAVWGPPWPGAVCLQAGASPAGIEVEEVLERLEEGRKGGPGGLT